MFTAAFWKDAFERCVRAAAASTGAALAAAGTGLIDTDWAGIGSMAGMAAVLSLMFSLAGGASGGTGSPAAILNAPKDGGEV